MITKVFTTSDFIHVAIAACGATGAAADPSVATASFYLISQIDGSLALDPRISDDGVVTLTKQGSQTGFFGAAVEISGLGAGQWVVLFKATIDGVATIVTDYLCIDPDYRVAHIVASALYDSDADSLLVTAWISFHGEIHSSPYDCTVTLYDETGTQVGEPLVDEVRDARGVFRMTMADAGLTLGSGYYAKVVIYGGSYNCTDLVGVVDIQEALAATGYTAARAALVDNLDAPITGIVPEQCGVAPENLFYLDPLNGIDTADGHTVATAVASWDKLFNNTTGLVKAAPDGPVLVRVLSDCHTFEESTAAIVPVRTNTGSIKIRGVNWPLLYSVDDTDPAYNSDACTVTVMAENVEITGIRMSHPVGNGIDVYGSYAWIHGNRFVGDCSGGNDINLGATTRGVHGCVIEQNIQNHEYIRTGANGGISIGNATLPSVFTSGSVNIEADTITWAGGHPFLTGDRIRFKSSGTLPAGINYWTNYWVYASSGTVIQVYTTQAYAMAHGATGLVDLTSTGSGTHYAAVSCWNNVVRENLIVNSKGGIVFGLADNSYSINNRFAGTVYSYLDMSFKADNAGAGSRNCASIGDHRDDGTWLSITNNGTACTAMPTPNDMHAVKGSTQSLSDLKDFADIGYDPSTHAVAALGEAERAAIIAALMATTGITAGGTASFETILQCLYSFARGKAAISSGVWTFYDDDGTTPLFTLTPAPTGRSVT